MADIDGDVLELGLGKNRRTYDHLRQQLPGRRIWVIDKVLNLHPSCIPPADNFLQGEAENVLVRLAARGRQIALAHYDFGYGVKEKDIAEGARLSPFIARLMAPGGLIVSQQPLIGVPQVTGPDTIDPERYLFYRAELHFAD